MHYIYCVLLNIEHWTMFSCFWLFRLHMYACAFQWRNYVESALRQTFPRRPHRIPKLKAYLSHLGNLSY